MGPSIDYVVSGGVRGGQKMLILRRHSLWTAPMYTSPTYTKNQLGPRCTRHNHSFLQFSFRFSIWLLGFRGCLIGYQRITIKNKIETILSKQIGKNNKN